MNHTASLVRKQGKRTREKRASGPLNDGGCALAAAVAIVTQGGAQAATAYPYHDKSVQQTRSLFFCLTRWLHGGLFCRTRFCNIFEGRGRGGGREGEREGEKKKRARRVTERSELVGVADDGWW